MMDQFPCPCCGYLTLEHEPPGSFDICPVCWWEDDRQQALDPDLAGGANVMSLRQAQENYRRFCVSDPADADQVREPLPHEDPRSKR